MEIIIMEYIEQKWFCCCSLPVSSAMQHMAAIQNHFNHLHTVIVQQDIFAMISHHQGDNSDLKSFIFTLGLMFGVFPHFKYCTIQFCNI